MKYLKQFFTWIALLFNPTARKRIKAIKALQKRNKELDAEILKATGKSKVTKTMREVTKWKRDGRSDHAIRKILRSRRIKFAKDHKMSKPSASQLQVASTGRQITRIGKRKGGTKGQ